MLESLAYIAEDTICRKNPFPRLDGFNESPYVCKCGLTDLYPEEDKILREAIESRKTFDTGWCECKKEIRSFRIITDGTIVTIQTYAAMDEFEDLVYDALDDDTKLTESQVEELIEYYYENDTEVVTETGSEITIPVTSYENIMEHISRMEDKDDKELDTMFNIVKRWVKDVATAIKTIEEE